jgi:hypothetical protein
MPAKKGYEAIDWINVCQDRIYSWAVLNVISKFFFPYKG